MKLIQLTLILLIGFSVISLAQTNDPLRRGSFEVDDPGANEGLRFLGTSANWSIDVSPTNRSDGDGNLNLYGTRNSIYAWRPFHAIGGDNWLVESGLQSYNVSAYLPGHIYIVPYGSENVTYLQARRSDNSGSTELQFRTWNNGTHNEALRIDDKGNVGIGTKEPNRALTVQSSAGTYINVKANAGSQEVLIGANSEAGIVSTMTNHDLQLRAGGNQTYMTIKASGDVGIGTSSPSSKLAVDGIITTEEIKVQNVTGADFVFAKDYDLPSLLEVATHIRQHQHLPDIPSAKEMQEEGLNLGKMNIKLLQKIEELTLYLIEQSEENANQQHLIDQLSEQVEKLNIRR